MCTCKPKPSNKFWIRLDGLESRLSWDQDEVQLIQEGYWDANYWHFNFTTRTVLEIFGVIPNLNEYRNRMFRGMGIEGEDLNAQLYNLGLAERKLFYSVRRPMPPSYVNNHSGEFTREDLIYWRYLLAKEFTDALRHNQLQLCYETNQVSYYYQFSRLQRFVPEIGRDGMDKSEWTASVLFEKYRIK